MKKFVFIVLLSSLFVGCIQNKGSKTHYVTLIPEVAYNTTSVRHGMDFHQAFMATEPLYLVEIIYKEDGVEMDKKYIARTYYENPPFEVDWEGVRVKMASKQEFEIWVDDAWWPETTSTQELVFNLETPSDWYDEVTLWDVVDIKILRTISAE